MKLETSTSEPSMDEILASIRQIISNNECEEKRTSLGGEDEEEGILDLTNVLPEEENSLSTFEKSQKSIAFIDEKKEGVSEPNQLYTQNPRFEDQFISQATIKEAVQAFSPLNKVTQEKPKSPDYFLNEKISGQTVENLVRNMLKPLLKEWLDANLPALVRWVVNEQVERIIHQGRVSSCDAPQGKFNSSS